MTKIKEALPLIEKMLTSEGLKIEENGNIVTVNKESALFSTKNVLTRDIDQFGELSNILIKLSTSLCYDTFQMDSTSCKVDCCFTFCNLKEISI